MPNDGTGALPLLRHITLNKGSTYKLALRMQEWWQWAWLADEATQPALPRHRNNFPDVRNYSALAN